MSGRRARARTATKARAMKGDARAARRIYLRFNRSKRAGDRLLSIIAHIRLAMLRAALRCKIDDAQRAISASLSEKSETIEIRLSQNGGAK